MPEVCEVIFTAQYLLSKLKGRLITDIKILSGRYTHEKISGIDMFKKNLPLKIINIDNKGKFMWFELKNMVTGKMLYIMNTFGLTGEWGFKGGSSDRVQFIIENSDGKKDKKYNLFYRDQRNFGTLIFTDDVSDLNNKLDRLERDYLKTNFTAKDFVEWAANFKHKKHLIIKILMEQDKNKGLGSGFGNYLAPEILYRAKISPHRTLESLSNDELINLANSIKYVVKLCYMNNKIGYMEVFKDKVDKHRDNIKKGKYPEYHKDVDIGNDEFKFSVYQQSVDPHGNKVKVDKILGDRSTYWVPNVQK